jgi:hypothetical protein
LRHVKCLNDAQLPQGDVGGVTLMVIPELGNQPLDEVLQPAASADLLEQVRLDLQSVAPPQALLTIKNPEYEPLKFRVAIRFNAGFGPGIYSPEVSTEIKKLLTPWADSQAEPQQLGNLMYFTEVINHLERLPYVDYVAVLKGFGQKTQFEGTDDERKQWWPIEEKSVRVSRPDALLVSDAQHKVDIIAGEHFNPEDYMGIGYMVVELDNIVE